MTFDEQIAQALDKTLSSLRTHLEADLRAFTHEFVRVAGSERERAMVQAAETAVADVRQQVESENAQFREAAARQEAELRQTTERQALELRSALHRQLEEGRRVAEERVNETSRGAEAKIDAARRAASLEVEAVRRTAAAQVEEVQREMEARLADASRETAAQLTAAMRGEQGRLNRLADAIRTLDRCAGIGEVLDRVAEIASQEVDRAAVLVVRSDGLRGWRFMNFEGTVPDRRTLAIAFAEAGVLRTVVRSGRPAAGLFTPAGGPEDATLPRFAQSDADRHVLVFPIPVAGQTVAVLYTDASPRLVSPDLVHWPTIIGIIGRHASRSLEAMTLRHAASLGTTRAPRRAPLGNA